LNRSLKLTWFEAGLMGITFAILLAVEITLAKTKPNALFFIVCILGVGMGLRATHKSGPVANADR
jgi:uncharacterized membrane protein